MQRRWSVCTLLRLAGIIALFAAMIGAAPEARGRVATMGQIDETGALPLYVIPQATRASDSNPGTHTLPLKTIARAVALSTENGLKNKATRILIAPGSYHESIDLPKETHSLPLIFEAIPGAGNVVLDGAEIWRDGWTREGKTDRYSHPWPYKWGTAPNPLESQGVQIEPIVRRKEMLFLNGSRLDQVMNDWELKPGCFSAAEDQKKLTVMLAPGATFPRNGAEVSLRETLLHSDGRGNLILRGITFQKAGEGVRIANADHLLVENCRFADNNGAGLAIERCKEVAIQGNVADANGGAGISVDRIVALVMEGNETSYDGWRETRNRSEMPVFAGLKAAHVHQGGIRRQISRYNTSVGLWLDEDNRDVTIDKCRLEDNGRDGARVEASEGPIDFKKCFVRGNRVGLTLDSSAKVTLDGNAFVGNQQAQISVLGHHGQGRRVENWETGDQFIVHPDKITLINNTIAATDASEKLFQDHWDDHEGWNRFLGQLTANHNAYTHPTDERVFYGTSYNPINIGQWRTEFFKDSDSSWRTGTPGITVRLTSPLEENVTPSGGAITLKAAATSMGKPLSRVGFYIDAARPIEVFASPYTTTWRNPEPGSHNLLLIATDLAGSVGLSQTTRIIVPAKDVPGSILCETWSDANRGTLDEVISGGLFEEPPSKWGTLPALETPNDQGIFFYQRMRGFLTAPASGAYTFWAASDDQAYLYLSTDDNPANKKRIAVCSSYVTPRDWIHAPEQKSPPILLTAGKKVYIEVLFRQATGADNLAVAWQGPGILQQVIPGKALTPLITKITLK